MKYGCIAEKLSHSFSKEIHAQLFGYDYTLREVPPNELDAFMRARDFAAINVTIPYKQQVLPYLDEISDIARRIGAVNTIVNQQGRLIGYNTDFLGLSALIKRAGLSLANKKVLVLGSGGTSKTALAVAETMGCRCVYRVSRNGRENCITYEQAAAEHADAQILINTTPCGMYPVLGETPVKLDTFPELEGIVDAVYNPLRSQLVCDALKRGLVAVGGLYMLVAQAAYAAEKFTEQEVPVDKIEAIYTNMRQKKENIVLVGMPGCGKSTVGLGLADALGCDFIDTDREIETRQGRFIPDIFERVGEAGFRDMETAVIREIASRQGAVIAIGGGAVLRAENVDWLRQNGRLYFLDRPLECLPVTQDRPLSSSRQALEQRYHERYATYCAVCDRRVPVEENVDQTIKTIIEDVAYEDFGD
ncbi:MAG: shikimate dehydrogenase [Clostridia bacterium]|nr:shikimate dehydrogenase [Clostridia bacterium]